MKPVLPVLLYQLSLIITNVSASDYGSYTATVSNGIGRALTVRFDLRADGECGISCHMWTLIMWTLQYLHYKLYYGVHNIFPAAPVTVTIESETADSVSLGWMP